MRLDVCEKAVLALMTNAPKDMPEQLQIFFEKLRENPQKCFFIQMGCSYEMKDRDAVLVGMLLGVSMAYVSDNPDFEASLNFLSNKEEEINADPSQ